MKLWNRAVPNRCGHMHNSTESDFSAVPMWDRGKGIVICSFIHPSTYIGADTMTSAKDT